MSQDTSTMNKELTEQELIKRKMDYVNKVVFEITKPQREEIEKLQKKIKANIDNWKNDREK